MTTFPLNDTGYCYRPLKRGLSGWDVYALQAALMGVGRRLPKYGSDGQFGSETDAALRLYQSRSMLTSDGIAGVLTQRQLCLDLIDLQGASNLPEGLERGQVEAESSYWLGNYTAPYLNDTRDLGVVEQNLLPTDASCFAAFNAPNAIRKLAVHLRNKHDEYYGMAGAQTHKRAWQLAADSWNTPSYADTLARGGSLTSTHQAIVDAYIQRVTVYAVFPL